MGMTSVTRRDGVSGRLHIERYDAEIHLRDNTVVFDFGIVIPPEAKISNGHYVMELEDGSVEMINMSEVLRISFKAVLAEAE